MLDTILSVTNEDLNRLTPAQAVDFFRELLWAEARRIGLPLNLINVPSSIYSADGGIDAEVDNACLPFEEGIIKHGLTRYQIKSGDFNPNNQLNSLVLGKRGKLKPKVQSCLDRDGTFIAVLLGWDNPQKDDDSNPVKKLREKLKAVNEKYASAKLEIWGQNNIRSFLRPFPSLALKVNKKALLKFSPYEQWQHHDDMHYQYIPGPEQQAVMGDLRDVIRKKNSPLHIRITGEPGIGKTRLVLEALGVDDLRPLAIYSSAEQFSDSDLQSELVKDTYTAILVLDECESDNSAYIWNKLKYNAANIILITISCEHNLSTGIQFFDVPPLQEKQISQIIQQYHIPTDQANRWAKLCSGSPRVAHVIGTNLQENPSDLFCNPASVDVWNRYIAGYGATGGPEYLETKLVLRYLSLFKRFGYGRHFPAETKAICRLINRTGIQVSDDRLSEIIQKLKRRKIIQEVDTLHITPKLLQIKLWTEWWEVYGHDFDIELVDLPLTLLDWFFQMFQYAASSPAASQEVRDLLGFQGPFQQNPEVLNTSLGSRFFLTLASVHPKDGLICLQRTIGTWTKEQLLSLVEGRRNIVWALVDMARRKSCFYGAAMLLLALGEAENERWANNASGVFAELFSLAIHLEITNTEASPQERFPVIKMAVEDSSREKRMLGLKAIEHALSLLLGGIVHDDQSFPSQRPLQPWIPETWGQVFDYYRQVWSFLESRLDQLPSDEYLEASNILINTARGVGITDSLSEMVTGTLRMLSTNKKANVENIVKVIHEVLAYDIEKMSPKAIHNWETLKDQLVTSEFSSRLQRYVKMNLIVDDLEEVEKYEIMANTLIKELATEATANPELLDPELEWLLTSEALNIHKFGYEIGLQDSPGSLQDKIIYTLITQENKGNLFFLGGYLRGQAESKPDSRCVVLERFAASEKLRALVPELTYRTGDLTQSDMERILRLYERGYITPTSLGVFLYGGELNRLLKEQVNKLINLLMESNEYEAVCLALGLCCKYYVGKAAEEVLPKELGKELVTHRSFFSNEPMRRFNPMTEHYWQNMAIALTGHYPDTSFELADLIIEHFADEFTILDGYFSRNRNILGRIMHEYPTEIWEKIGHALHRPRSGAGYIIRLWLRGIDAANRENFGALSLITPEVVWLWVEKDKETNSLILAEIVPKIFHRDRTPFCWARELLIRYGYFPEVRDELIRNFSQESWWGLESIHIQERKEKYLEYRKEEDNPFVCLWLDEYIAYFDDRIGRVKIEEEREKE